MTRRDSILKWSVYALGLVPVWLLEAMVLNRLPLFGVIPVLLPLAAVAVGLWEGAQAGAGFGLGVGVLADAVYPGLPGGMTLGLSILGLLAGAAGQYRVRQTYVGYLLCSVGAMVLLETCRVVWGALSGLGRPAALLRVAGLEAGWSLCFTPLIYFLFKLLYRKVGGEKLGG